VVGFSRLSGADEDRTLARLRALRSDLIDPTIAVHNGRVIKRTGDGALVEFRSVVDAVRCAIEVQNAMVERNAGVPDDRRIEFRVGVHLGDVVEESDGDLMGDGVNIAARLEGIAQPGAICLSEDAYRQVRARLDLEVNDLGATQLKNIVEPVRVFSLQVGLPAQAKPAASTMLTPPEKPTDRLALPDKPSIAVLPFQNMSGDSEQEYFVDGIVEDIITGLSRIKWLFDQITEKVVGIVEPSLRRSEIERSRRKRPENLDAYDLYLRALPHMATAMPADARIAAVLLEDALRLDPNYAAAHAVLAWCHEICFSRAGFGDADRIAWLQHARAAITSGTDDATALATAAFVIALLSKDYKAAASGIERALSFNPSCAAAHYFGSQVQAFTGNPAGATAHANIAFRLSPFEPLALMAHVALGVAALQEARYDEAASHFAKAVQANHFSSLYFFHAGALALAGHVEEAKPIVLRGFELDPGFRVRVLVELGFDPTIADKLAEGARLLGVPE
jgi:class 3 adenylate cyclase/tetratricopeptide (TPR) repeat protein